MTSQLSIGAFFFACKSCEYLKVPQAEKQRTDVLQLRSIRFFRNGKDMNHKNPWLEFADCISITFEWQKEGERIGHCHTNGVKGSHSLSSAIVDSNYKKIWEYTGPTEDTLVSAVWRYGRLEHISSKEMTEAPSRSSFGDLTGRCWNPGGRSRYALI